MYPYPNLLFVLHYVSKALWLVLAGIFGIIGYQLYAMGIAQPGTAVVKFPWMNFTLKDAGPGLVVMVFALGCSLVGAVRSKVRFRGPGPKGKGKVDIEFSTPGSGDSDTKQFESTGSGSVRECKLFRDLLKYLEMGSGAYVGLDSQGQIDLESVGWSVVPLDIRQQAVTEGLAWIRSLPKPTGDEKSSQQIGLWIVKRNIVASLRGDKFWCLVQVTARAQTDKDRISAEEAKMILNIF
jgi:hypothetical protein